MSNLVELVRITKITSTNMESIKEKQDRDADLQQSATRHPEWYSRKDINSVANVLCYTRPNDDPSN